MSPALEDRLALCRNLPTLPAVAVQIIDLAQSPDADLASVARAIGLDPALATKLLRIANSPLYASKRRVDNVRQALTVLGLNSTLSLALSFSLTRSLRGQNWGQRFDHESIWRRSILAAGACRILGSQLGLPRGEDLMLAGLVQDIGMLALSQIEPEQYAAILSESTDNASLVALERERLGTDHAAIGARLAQMWGLPEFLIDAIRQSESEQPDGRANLCVALSGPIADIWVREEPERMRKRAADLCERHFDIDRMRFAGITTLVSESIPEISSLFDIKLADPQRIDAILEYARELMVIRNLKGLQEASRERIEAERLHNEARALQDAARRDALTGLYNRAYLDERLEAEFEASRERAWPLTVAFLDLDGFKQINDRHGHLVGDEVLRNFAQVLGMNLRDSDVMARYGGDEFCLLLPGAGEAPALSLARRTLEAVASTPMAEVDGEILRITMSIGVACMDSGHPYPSATALIESADRALYKAKEGGRNRVATG